MSKQCGGAVGDGAGAGAGTFPQGSAPNPFDGKLIGDPVSGLVASQVAMMSKIPQTIVGQGMGFQASTSSLHRRRFRKRSTRKQRGGAAAPYPDSFGAVLPQSMTGPMRLAESYQAGGSGTGTLDNMLSQTRSAVQQFGGGKRKSRHYCTCKCKKPHHAHKKMGRGRSRHYCTCKCKKQHGHRRTQRRQQQQRQQQQRQQQQQQQRGGALGYAPADGPYTLLSGADLQKAGLNPQWFDENQVNPGFGGAITVPG